ncbi:MAG: hypothetical protein U0822_14345 [Anaerolineae bacterium]
MTRDNERAVNAAQDEELDNLTAPRDNNIGEEEEGPDFARGQRTTDTHIPRPHHQGDFARGMEERPVDEEDESDFARGQREDERSSYIPGQGVTGSEEDQGPDFARGQRTRDRDTAE